MKARLTTIILFLILLTSSALKAQVLVTSDAFTTGSTYLEPDGRNEVIKISGSEFVTITKSRGGASGSSEFSLQKYDLTLKPKFTTVLNAESTEDYKDLYFNGTDIVLLSVIHNINDQESKLLAYGFDVNTGAKKWDKELDKTKVAEWVTIKYKGVVKESFENCVGSCLSKNFVTPLQYQYHLKFSPDSSKLISYIFDYGQKTLVANLKVYDKNLAVIDTAIINIDNNFINYGIYVNNLGELFIMNVDRLGRIVVIKYNIKSKENKLLDIQYSSSNRESLNLQILNNDAVYVANVTVSGAKLTGVMYSKFDFKTNLVEKINYHEISEGLRQTVHTTRSSSKNVKGEENWLNYEITHFFLNSYEKVVIALEKREINSPGYTYDPGGVNDPQKWQEKVAKVNTEGVILFSFNANDELMWENYYLKSQNVDVSNALVATSFSFYETEDSKLRMIYASSDNAAGILNVINYVEWDGMNGNKIKDIPLQNEEGLGLIRNYTIWWDDKLVLVGRKGLLGKKSIIHLYKIT